MGCAINAGTAQQAPRRLLGTRVDIVGEVNRDDRRRCHRTHGPIRRERRRRPKREVWLQALRQLGGARSDRHRGPKQTQQALHNFLGVPGPLCRTTTAHRRRMRCGDLLASSDRRGRSECDRLRGLIARSSPIATKERAISVQLHSALATASFFAMAAAGIEAGFRVWRNTPPGVWASRLQTLLLLALIITAAGGLGLFVGGARPAEVLHFLYALLAVGAVPLANSFAGGRPPRQRALATLVGTLVGLVLIVRLFATG